MREAQIQNETCRRAKLRCEKLQMREAAELALVRISRRALPKKIQQMTSTPLQLNGVAARSRVRQFPTPPAPKPAIDAK
jgi:hypothetical protein